MGRRRIVRCDKCNKELFYLSSKYKMSCEVICVSCGRNKKTKKKAPRTAAANFAMVKGGVREDIHPTYFFRSRTEANFARILQYHGVEWEFEQRKFTFKEFGYQRGPWAYLMDFNVKSSKKLPDGLRSGWVEVKGWMKPESRNRLRRLRKCYPGDAAKTLVVLYERRKKDIEFCEKTGYDYIFYSDLREKYSILIPTWE